MVFLVPPESVNQHAASMFSSVAQFPAGKGCTLSIGQSAAQNYMVLTAADVGKPVDLYEKKPMDTVRDVTMNMPKTKV